MSNELHAQIFGRKRKGDREEVKMKLFHADGTEFEPGSTVTGRVINGVGSPSKLGPLAPVASDDFSVDRRDDPAWWSRQTYGPPADSLSGGKFNAGTGFGNLMFMVPPPGVESRVILPFRFTDAGVVQLATCAEKTLSVLGLISSVDMTTLTFSALVQENLIAYVTKEFTTPLVLDHLYTLSITTDAECRGSISLYDGVFGGTSIDTVPFDLSVYKNYFVSTPGRSVFSGFYFIADEFIYEVPSPPVPIGQNDDLYIDSLTGDIYGPKAEDKWPPAPSIRPGLSTKMADVIANVDMAPADPEYHIDCSEKTVVHARKLSINSSTVNKRLTICLDNLKPGTPYHVSVENYSNFAHQISVKTNNNLADQIIVSNQIKRDSLLLAANEMCSIMSFYTGPIDRPLAVATQSPRSPRRTVVANYTCTEYDLNGLIIVNSANPVTITLRDHNNTDWWVGEEIEIHQQGAGIVTVAGPAGTVITRPGGATGNFALPGGRYSTVKLRCMSIAKWVVV